MCPLSGSSGNGNAQNSKDGQSLNLKLGEKLKGREGVVLSFNYYKTTASGTTTLTVNISTDGGTTKKTLLTLSQGKGNTWYAASVNIDDVSSASNVVITFTGRARLDDILITATSTDTRPATSLAFGQTSYSVNKDATVSAKATLTNSSTFQEITGATITYTSSDESVATVASDGTITGVKAGTATITATYDGDDTYQGSTATCTVTVVDPNAPTYVYKKITSADDIVNGGTYIVVCESYNKAMGSHNSGDYSNPVDITIANDIYSGNVNTSTTPYEITLAKTSNTDDYFSIKTEEGYLHSSTSTSGSTSIQVASTLGTSADYQWTLSYSEGAITLKTNVNFSPSRQILYSNNGRFANYASKNAKENGYGVVSLYKKVEADTFSITTENYATFYTDDAFIMPEGVKGGVITSYTTEDNVKKLSIDYRYPAGSTVPAKTALLLNGENNTYTYVKTTTGDTAPTNNLLHGANAVDNDGKTYVAATDGGTVRYYILTHKNGANYGFYWATANGAAVTYHAPFAFLAIETSESQSVNGFSLEDATTGIASIATTTPAPAAIYTLSGLRVNAASTDNLPAGIYIVGGKKVIVK